MICHLWIFVRACNNLLTASISRRSTEAPRSALQTGFLQPSPAEKSAFSSKASR